MRNNPIAEQEAQLVRTGLKELEPAVIGGIRLYARF
jgi:hypothetical protein